MIGAGAGPRYARVRDDVVSDRARDADLESSCSIAREMFAADTASRALGIEIAELAPGRATATMTVRESMVNGHGITHGGYVFALADTAFALACNSRDVAGGGGARRHPVHRLDGARRRAPRRGGRACALRPERHLRRLGMAGRDARGGVSRAQPDDRVTAARGPTCDGNDSRAARRPARRSRPRRPARRTCLPATSITRPSIIGRVALRLPDVGAPRARSRLPGSWPRYGVLVDDRHGFILLGRLLRGDRRYDARPRPPFWGPWGRPSTPARSPAGSASSREREARFGCLGTVGWDLLRSRLTTADCGGPHRRVERRPISNVVVAGEAVLGQHVRLLAEMLGTHHPLAVRLERALTQKNSMVALTSEDRERLLELLADPPSGLAALRTVLLRQQKQRDRRPSAY